jgi:hypothetical protein
VVAVRVTRVIQVMPRRRDFFIKENKVREIVSLFVTIERKETFFL